MTMSHSKPRLTIRLPDFLRLKLEAISDQYEMSTNEIIKHLIIQGIDIYKINDVQSDSKNPVFTANVTAEVIKPDFQCDSKNPSKGANVTAPEIIDWESGQNEGDSKNPQKQANVTAPLVRTLKIYNIINNKDIYIEVESLREAWDEFVQMRKELKKSIKPTTMKRIWKSFDPILEAQGVEPIIKALNRSVQNGWQGIFLDEDKKIESTGTFGEEDF